ncbi:Ubiquitin-conjugating enzyme E2 B [Conglomerata obtusa]
MTIASDRLTLEWIYVNKFMFLHHELHPVWEGYELNLFKWKCSFFGPDVPLYENSYFFIKLEFTEEYPYKPPKVSFTFPIIHPNINTAGDVSPEAFGSVWKTNMGVREIITAVKRLLATPNLNFSVNAYAARTYKNKKEYEKKVKENIEKYHPSSKYIDYAALF